ncbi:hypothetical protein LSAT2_015325 [Lamellibrachia satsuma]|nr:hypothetical protein LSAT2_015325 [Lamellibrachia satsuma]
MMAPCKRQLKATRHLICGSCSNWVDFVKSGCEKSWAEIQADSFSFECRGCTKMKELEVELEELRLLVVAMVGREQGGCASSSSGGTVDDKVGKDTRDTRESSPQSGGKLRGGKVTGRKETGRKGMGGKTTGVKERGVGETGRKEKGVGETGGKTTGVKERGVGETRAKEWEVGETGGKGSGQNVMTGIERKSYSAAVIEGVRKRARVFVGDSIVRKTDRVLNKGDDVVVCMLGAKIEAITERVKNIIGSDGLIVCHLPYGPTAYFTLANTVMRHDIPGVGKMSEAYPHLIFNNLTSKLGQRVMSILKYLFPVPKEDSRRVITFANEEDYISFRHHIYKKVEKSIELTEVGPRFEMKLYQVILGTLDMTGSADVEWVYRPYMNTAKKRRFLAVD